MVCRNFAFQSESDWESIYKWLVKRQEPDMSVEEPVRQILNQVLTRGDTALIEYTTKFDCPDYSFSQLKVSAQQIKAAYQQVPDKDLEIISEAVDNIYNFHKKQLQNSWFTTQDEGTVLGQMLRPMDRAGLYVPGGQGGETPLISSLIMNAVPALVAGVKSISLVSPPNKEGLLNPYILATAKILGLENIYSVGSAWAIAALAFGSESIPAVDVIAGPGNIFVTTAKRLLVGRVGIDMIAGPSEIAILADKNADPDWLAADLLSQAEHDTLASAILISPQEKLLKDVEQSLQDQLSQLPRQDIAQKSLADWGALIQVPDLDKGLELVNKIAPEHFEICVDNPWAYVGKIRNAGAVFMGHNAAEPIGDYFAGPNHVLPTIGTARFSSALSVDTFCKKISLIANSREYVQKHGQKIARLARLEGLEAHARSVEIRNQK